VRVIDVLKVASPEACLVAAKDDGPERHEQIQAEEIVAKWQVEDCRSRPAVAEPTSLDKMPVVTLSVAAGVLAS
jgi:hypothetical protein